MFTSEESVIECVQLGQGYRGNAVLHGFSLSASVGLLTLLGPNGAGKSTVLRTLATLMPPERGTLSILGEQVSNEASARRARRNIGFLPQDYGYFPRFSVEEFVTYCAWLREVPRHEVRQAADEAIAKVGLTTHSDRQMRQLSGGMRQRAGIAGALVGSPRVLLLDEPTVGLDPEQRIQFRQLISEVARRAAVIVSTHLVDDLSSVGGEVVVINAGRVVFSGNVEELTSLGSRQFIGPVRTEVGASVLETAYLRLVQGTQGNTR